MSETPTADATPPEAETDLAGAVRLLGHTSALVVGDVMLDRYVFGAVERISPEAPVPILTVDRELAMPGGAGNVVRNLTALGAAVAFISVVGDDQAGSDLTGLIGGQPGVEPWLLVQGGRVTTLKTRYLSAGQQLLRADREETSPIQPRLAERLVRIARDAMAATSVTVLSDYQKGLLTGELPAQLIAAAREAGRPVIVDPKGPDYSRYAGADVIMPNRADLAEATGMRVDSEAAIVAAATALRQRHGFGAVVVTRGNDGMTLLDATGARHYPAEAAEVYDVAGAGDTAAATMAAALAARLSLPVAVRLANIAAGIVVGKVGTAVVREADLLAALSPQGGAFRKIVSREAAVEYVQRWHHKGWRVGFTNGCFDLLHPGHLHLLEEAREACDRLVVGLNSDASVRRLKGADRPVQPEAARAAVLARLASVDLVTVFDEDTPEALIGALHPDLLVKGANYALDQVVGTDLVRGWGGRVMLAELLPGHSTSATVERMRSGAQSG
jgi:D-beta-D-heptose 7-phosphate kinase/D-beta-D-heptose 1-phosphate adenosyltransferase